MSPPDELSDVPVPPVLDDPEARLVASLRANDESAFADLVETHGPRLLVAARRLLPNEEDARDAVQDAFLSAFRAIHQFDGNARLSTWLHRIVINAALARLRRASRKREQSIDGLLPSFHEDGHQAQPAVPWRDGPPDPAQIRETRDLVRASIEELPESYRTVLLLRDIEGLDTEETAQALGLTSGVVKTRLHRARQALRTLLDPFFRREAI